MSTQQNPTLIPGFEDIIRHIKQQEDQIKKLEKNNKEQQDKMTKLYQENQELKEENKKLKEDHCSNKKMFFEVYEENMKLKEEIIRLEEEGIFMDDYGNLTAEEEEADNCPEKFGQPVMRDKNSEEEQAEEWLKQNR